MFQRKLKRLNLGINLFVLILCSTFCTISETREFGSYGSDLKYSLTVKMRSKYIEVSGFDDPSHRFILDTGSWHIAWINERQKLSYKNKTLKFYSDYSEQVDYYATKNVGPILPEVSGIIGNSMFWDSCYIREGEVLEVYSKESLFCRNPELFLDGNWKFIQAQQRTSQLYIMYRTPKGISGYALFDTGSSMSMMPSIEFGNVKKLGVDTVHFYEAGAKAIEKFESKIEIIQRNGQRILIPNMLFFDKPDPMLFPESDIHSEKDFRLIGFELVRNKSYFVNFSTSELAIK